MEYAGALARIIGAECEDGREELPELIKYGLINSGIGARKGGCAPNGVPELGRPDPGKTGRSAAREPRPERVTRVFRPARRPAPTCEYPLPEPLRSTSRLLLSSPEICPDLRKRHSERAVPVLDWIATEGVPVT
ncbi:hypothetical protein GCM10010359_20190 [Streptomyces morookaense]|nr:hypothetical protein GCM10010359_20190 [Streptomyces morookaense]